MAVVTAPLLAAVVAPTPLSSPAGRVAVAALASNIKLSNVRPSDSIISVRVIASAAKLSNSSRVKPKIVPSFLSSSTMLSVVSCRTGKALLCRAKPAFALDATMLGITNNALRLKLRLQCAREQCRRQRGADEMIARS
jgi:hypothetical protein